jgi:hypothetical protein
MAAVAIALTSGRYLVSTHGTQRLIRALREIGDDFPDAFVVATMLQDAVNGTLSRDLELGDSEREAVLRALDEALGQGPLSEELYSLRDGLVKEAD